MDNQKMTERELVDGFQDAMHYGHIYVVYQPKMNHFIDNSIHYNAVLVLHWNNIAFLGHIFNASLINELRFRESDKQILIYVTVCLVLWSQSRVLEKVSGRA